MRLQRLDRYCMRCGLNNHTAEDCTTRRKWGGRMVPARLEQRIRVVRRRGVRVTVVPPGLSGEELAAWRQRQR